MDLPISLLQPPLQTWTAEVSAKKIATHEKKTISKKPSSQIDQWPFFPRISDSSSSSSSFVISHQASKPDLRYLFSAAAPPSKPLLFVSFLGCWEIVFFFFLFRLVSIGDVCHHWNNLFFYSAVEIRDRRERAKERGMLTTQSTKQRKKRYSEASTVLGA